MLGEVARSGDLDVGRRMLAEAGLDVDYLERRGDRVLAAVRVGATRLIDNVPVVRPST